MATVVFPTPLPVPATTIRWMDITIPLLSAHHMQEKGSDEAKHLVFVYRVIIVETVCNKGIPPLQLFDYP